MFLNNKKILITGATGLIGKSLVKYILSNCPNTYVLALVRNLDKANQVFSYYKGHKLKLLVGNVESITIRETDIDYIIHAASQTESKAFVTQPVETILTSLRGTHNMLEVAKKNRIEKFIYLSSMEIYGTPTSNFEINENSSNNINTMDIRSSYSESKRICENLCASYNSEYSIPVVILRLTQTFGPGVEYNDKRVFAEFARSAIEGRNIILRTNGKTKRKYLYIDDAISAILIAMEKGKSGEAYNVANDATYCTIYEMAQFIADKYGINIEIKKSDIAMYGYANTLYMNLDTTKIKSLGWSAKVNLIEMYEKMIEYMKISKNI